MSLQPLFKAQAALDKYIVEKQRLKEISLSNMILAVIVELGEMSNDWGGFKHWKVNPQPKEGLLGEIADVLSFILAIGNMLHHRKLTNFFEPEQNQWELCSYDNITDQIIALIADFTDLWSYGEIGNGYSMVITKFAILTEMLGFTWEQVEEAYYAKNKINHERQEASY
ncbi:dUTP diphosphatase [Lysinibacillus sp. UGB7]|uniref:dUTP diphosphatase n=1 Tax=Lysinibacillus sp. UGB7 TaxID=3411039 RepID=UPI003B7DCF00